MSVIFKFVGSAGLEVVVSKNYCGRQVVAVLITGAGVVAASFCASTPKKSNARSSLNETLTF